MIFLFTGMPGSYKTMSAIQFVTERFVEKEKREVYAYGIRDLDVPHWHNVETMEEIREWWNFPKGSVIVFDEAQELMPQRGTGRPPEWIERFALHRHADRFAPNSGAVDIVLITQDAMMVDVFVRRLVNEFRHNVRPLGLSYANVQQFSKVGDPDDYHFKKTAIKNYKYKENKKYFGAYKSTDVHTIKRNWPIKKLLVLAATVGLVVGLAIFLWHLKTKWGDKNGQPNGRENSVVAVSGGGAVGSGVGGVSAADRLDTSSLNSYIERVPGMTHTAPRYDQLTKPTKVAMPVACVASKDRCTCFSQQGTKMGVHRDQCELIVAQGYFEDFDYDPARSAERSQSKAVSEAIARANADERGKASFGDNGRVQVIGDEDGYGVLGKRTGGRK
ncbi:zonular occludens toxin domain-containing protein [Collimonas antrihumi]|uniref:zonular occludens toxin domain-containing protein n=1 Tax=Collimonas antrihumi TaxID=1940615 RepID=UPI001B8B165C|nr:zonular occludens toxin domain-containing protein [Collimonas antrihumi]